jgi:DNA invertase Pin-like site-specific DNA recombinase
MGMGPTDASNLAVLYVRVSSKEQERDGFSIPAQRKMLKEYAADKRFQIVREFEEVETAKSAGPPAFGEMIAFLQSKPPPCPILLDEKTDRLYRNIKDWVTVADLDIEIHLVKEGVVLSDESRSSEKFMHGIRVLMAKNYIDNLSEKSERACEKRPNKVTGRR